VPFTVEVKYKDEPVPGAPAGLPTFGGPPPEVSGIDRLYVVALNDNVHVVDGDADLAGVFPGPPTHAKGPEDGTVDFICVCREPGEGRIRVRAIDAAGNTHARELSVECWQ
jgi:hypothetical protein